MTAADSRRRPAERTRRRPDRGDLKSEAVRDAIDKLSDGGVKELFNSMAGAYS